MGGWVQGSYPGCRPRPINTPPSLNTTHLGVMGGPRIPTGLRGGPSSAAGLLILGVARPLPRPRAAPARCFAGGDAASSSSASVPELESESDRGGGELTRFLPRPVAAGFVCKTP